MRNQSHIIVLLTLLLFPAASWGASVQMDGENPVRWTQETVSFVVHQDGSTDIWDATDLSAVRAGFDQWQDLSCAYISFDDQGLTASKSVTVVGYGTNGKNEVVWVEDNLWPAGQYVLGITTTTSYAGGTIIEADIAFNGYLQTWSTNDAPNTVDVLSVATHEIGHFMGIQHALSWPDPSDPPTMAPAADPYGKSKDLNADDAIGACFLYPDGYTCSSNDNCPYIIADGAQGEYYSGQVTCIDGLCGGLTNEVPFGDQVLGESCSSDFDCFEENVFCQAISAEESYCAKSCEDPEGNDCPPGLICVGFANVPGGVCLPESEFAEEEKKGLGENCAGGAECLSLLCISPPGTGSGVCAEECDPTLPTSCKPDYNCVQLSGVDYGACLPASNESTGKYEGEPCTSATECLTNLCVGSVDAPGYYCRNSCDPQNPTCPDAYNCVSLVSGDYAGACIPLSSNSLAGDLGDTCEDNTDCESGVCIEISGGGPGYPFCAEACGTCPCGFTCTTFTGGEKWCVPSVKQGCVPDGSPCELASECSSDFCYGFVCQSKCIVTAPECPPGKGCQRLTTNEISGVCVEPGTAMPGEPCESDSECNSLFCDSIQGAPPMCIIPCDPEDPGNCGDALLCFPVKAGVGGCILDETQERQTLIPDDATEPSDPGEAPDQDTSTGRGPNTNMPNPESNFGGWNPPVPEEREEPAELSTTVEGCRSGNPPGGTPFMLIVLWAIGTISSFSLRKCHPALQTR